MFIVTTMPARQYFVPKPGEHDVTLTSFSADLSEHWEIPSLRVCDIDEESGVQTLVAISSFTFLGMGRKVDAGRFLAIGVRVKVGMNIHR